MKIDWFNERQDVLCFSASNTVRNSLDASDIAKEGVGLDVCLRGAVRKIYKCKI